MLNFTDDSFSSFHSDFLVDPESLLMGHGRQNIFYFHQRFSELNWIDVNLIVARFSFISSHDMHREYRLPNFSNCFFFCAVSVNQPYDLQVLVLRNLKEKDRTLYEREILAATPQFKTEQHYQRVFLSCGIFQFRLAIANRVGRINVHLDEVNWKVTQDELWSKHWSKKLRI